MQNKPLRQFVQRQKKNPYLYLFLLVLVAATYLTLAFTYAHRLPSRVDEGSFLIKGYYFISGRYQPFEAYGPWTNNMPLAYLIPGIPQVLLGPGLRTGRYFAIFLSILTLAGLWLIIHRMRGKWWALAGVFALAINPSLIQTSVQGLSQGIVACLLTWMLVCLLEEQPKQWQIALGSLLSAATVLTRQNMVFLLPFIWLFALWLHGKKAALLTLVCTLIPLVLVHAFYFPEIMTLWFSWMPSWVKHLFDMGLVAGGGVQTWKPDVDFLMRITSFFTAMRYHFLMLAGVWLCMMLLPKKNAWQSQFERKSALTLILVFLILFLMHAWASLAKNYCVYCFPTYITFFYPIGMILAILGISNFFESKQKIPVLLTILFTMIVIPGLFFGSIENIGASLLSLPVPRFKEGSIQPGTAELWVPFSNYFNIPYGDLLFIIPPVIGGLISVGLIIVVWLILLFSQKRQKQDFNRLVFGFILVMGMVLTPSGLLGQTPSENTCGGDVIAAYEKVGSELQDLIPSGESLYWAAGSVVTPLLYIPDAGIHPPQLNGIYSYRRGGNRDLLERAGYFNEESVLDWRSTDSFIINSNRNMVAVWQEILNPEEFDEYHHTSPLDPCEPASYLRIFKRKND